MSSRKFSLPLEELDPGMVTAERISLRDEEGLTILSLKPRTALTLDTINRLKRHKVEEVVVYFGDSAPPETPPVKSFIDEKVKSEAVTNIRSLFGAVGDGNKTTAFHAVKELNDLVDHLVDTITSESNSFVHIADLKSYDEYTYHHSLSVAVLSIAIGKNMGFSESQLKKLGQCAIMHDIGKTLIPVEIINKPGKLTDEEFDIIKQHSLKGGQYLLRNQIGDQELWQAIVHHHEKVNGTGYPEKLKGDIIPLFSRIISVADVYDAVTSYRSYRKPMPPSEAIELVMSEVGKAFDFEVVKVFVDVLEPYPINTVVELNGDRRGMVIENNVDSYRPILRMLDDGNVLDLTQLDNLTLIITKVVDADTE